MIDMSVTSELCSSLYKGLTLFMPNNGGRGNHQSVKKYDPAKWVY